MAALQPIKRFFGSAHRGWFATTSYPGLFINNPDTGHKVLSSDWPIKTHNPRSKIIESCQISIANTKFRAFRQSNKRRIIILQANCFPGTTDASQEVHRRKMPHVKPESKEIYSSYNCVNRRIFWRRKGCCFDILVMTQMDLPGKQAPVEHCSIPG